MTAWPSFPPLYSSLLEPLYIAVLDTTSTPAPLAASLLLLLVTSHPILAVQIPIPLASWHCPTVPVAVHDGVEAVGNSKDSAVSKLAPDRCLD